jgi:predicted nucleic acid-binding protein
MAILLLDTTVIVDAINGKRQRHLLLDESQNRWRKKGHTLSLPDVTIAAVALTHGLTLLTDNRKDFPMPELALYSLP